VNPSSRRREPTARLRSEWCPRSFGTLPAINRNRCPQSSESAKNNGEISEAASGKSKDELDKLRKESREIDSWDNKNKAVVSVRVLREGWDVQNVTTIVGLRPYTSKARILPEQTLGRGRMFRGQGIEEKVSVVGTHAFIDFVESIKSEGVDLEYKPMGERTPGAGPMVIEVDRENKTKDIEALDIELPRLTARIEREYKNLDLLDPLSLPANGFR
jgi:type III restriction enzyme